MYKLLSSILWMILLMSVVVACGPDTTTLEPENISGTENVASDTTELDTIDSESEGEASAEDAVSETVESDTMASESEDEANIEIATNDTASDVINFKLEAWADNWFAAYLGDQLIVEDSVSITTERSFNAETAQFEASYPLHLNFILKDFKENQTGLEYIGERNQQMGDGGFIMQLTDMRTDQVVAVSNTDWACLVIHDAPLDKSCERETNPVAGVAPCEFSDLGEPAGWQAADFDDTGWNATTAHSVNDVSPKDGYDQIDWEANAQLIWGPDLETNNTLLCRVTVTETAP